MSFGEKQILPNGNILQILCPLVWDLPNINMERTAIVSKQNGGTENTVEVNEHPSIVVVENQTDYFSNLNEDCLLPILTQLNTFELIAVSQINNYLNDICFMLINKRERDFYTTELIDEKILDFETISKSNRNRSLTFAETEALLKCVGGYIKTINLKSSTFKTRSIVLGQCKSLQLDCILQLINRYCARGNLERIYIDSFYLVKNAGQYTNIWKNLKTLSLINYSMDEHEVEAILKQTTQLNTFELELLYITRAYDDYVDGYDIQFLAGTCMFRLPKTVENLTLRNCRGLKLYNLIKILEFNKQILSFTYTSFYEDAFGAIVYGQIASRLKSLKSLRLGAIGNSSDNAKQFKRIVLHQNIASLANLSCLTKFVFDGNGLNVAKLFFKLAQNNTIIEMSIRNCCIQMDNESMANEDSVPSFTSLKILELFFTSKNDMTDDFFTGLAQVFRTPSLDDFYVEHIDFGNDELKPLYLTQFENGLELFLKSTMNLRRIMLKIPALRIAVHNYLRLMRLFDRMNRQRDVPTELPIYLLRRNLTLELSQFLYRLEFLNNYTRTIDFKLFFACSEYFL